MSDRVSASTSEWEASRGAAMASAGRSAMSDENVTDANFILLYIGQVLENY
jgi:hypothetical protein